MKTAAAVSLLLAGASAFDLAVVREDERSSLPACASVFSLPGTDFVVATAPAGSAASSTKSIVWRPEIAGKKVRTLVTNQAGALREHADSHTMVFQVGDFAVVEVAAEQEAVFEIASYELGLRLQDVEPVDAACQRQKKLAPLLPVDAANPKKKTVVDDVVAAVDGDAWFSVLEEITGEKPYTVGGRNTTTRTRYTLANEHYDVADHFEELCVSLGYQASQPTFTVSGTTTQNVICVKPGSSSEVVVVGGHYDSTSRTPSTYAPGAVDNGSGAVGVLALAKAMAGHSFEKTVHFAFWGGEEQGLYGSTDYVRKNTNTITAAIQMDMIAYSNRYYGVTLECDRTAACGTLMDLGEDNMKEYAPDLQINKVTFSFGSDHVPFQNAGIPCFLAIQLDDTNYPGYHDVSDQVNYVNMGQSVGILRGLAGTVATLAGPL